MRNRKKIEETPLNFYDIADNCIDKKPLFATDILYYGGKDYKSLNSLSFRKCFIEALLVADPTATLHFFLSEPIESISVIINHASKILSNKILSKKDSVWVNDENGLICIAYQMEQDDYLFEFAFEFHQLFREPYQPLFNIVCWINCNEPTHFRHLQKRSSVCREYGTL
jgi:hypothetical protein